MSQPGNPLPNLLDLAQLNHALVPRVGSEHGHELRHVVARSLEPLEEDAAAEDQDAGDALRRVAPPRGFDDAVDLGGAHALGGAAAVDHVVKQRVGAPQEGFVAMGYVKRAHRLDSARDVPHRRRRVQRACNLHRE